MNPKSVAKTALIGYVASTATCVALKLGVPATTSWWVVLGCTAALWLATPALYLGIKALGAKSL